MKHALVLFRRNQLCLLLLLHLLFFFLLLSHLGQTKLQMTNLDRHPVPHMSMHPHLARSSAIRTIPHNGDTQRRQLTSNLMRSLRPHQLHVHLHHVLHPHVLRGVFVIRPPQTMREGEVVRIAVLARDARGAKVSGVGRYGRDLHEAAGPFVVGRLGFVADEDLGRGGLDVDIVFDGVADQVFDAFDVVGVFDAYETTVGFGEASNLVVGTGFELLRHVGTEFLLGRCQDESVHFGLDAEWEG
mmetsp:Transcript_20233/g.32823  ORF Transcript_20233/g.32823 Transcript_20233/m.32823 type:complete len:243 (-) Transcript_20233:111-839(-)